MFVSTALAAIAALAAWMHVCSRWKTCGIDGDGSKASPNTIFRGRVDLGLELGQSPGGVHVRVGEVKDAPAVPAAVPAGAAIFVLAVATVDQEWGARLVRGWPDTGPQVLLRMIFYQTRRLQFVRHGSVRAQKYVLLCGHVKEYLVEDISTVVGEVEVAWGIYRREPSRHHHCRVWRTLLDYW